MNSPAVTALHAAKSAQMDMYFEVGELTFPRGRASRWLETVLPETDRDAEDRRTVKELFAELEGDVMTKLEGDRFVARVLLIDGAFFEPQDALALALDAAATAGAKGSWFSGSEHSGEASSFNGKRRAVEEDAEVTEQVMAWMLECGPAPKKKKKRLRKR